MGIESIGAVVSSSGSSAFSRAEIITSSQTWTHPDGLDTPKPVKILAMGAGGGGGSGAATNAGSVGAAGAGGGGGSGYVRTYEGFVSNPLTVVIGAAGNGGSGVVRSGNVGNTDGNSGNGGGATTVSQSSPLISIVAPPGSGGGGGRGSGNVNSSNGGSSGGSHGGLTFLEMTSNSFGGGNGQGGSQGGGRTGGQVGNAFETPVAGQGAKAYFVEFGGSSVQYRRVSFDESQVADAKYCSGAGGGGNTAQRGQSLVGNANGGLGIYGNGGAPGKSSGSTSSDPAPGSPGLGFGSGGGGGGGQIAQTTGTVYSESGGAGAPGLVIIYY